MRLLALAPLTFVFALASFGCGPSLGSLTSSTPNPVDLSVSVPASRVFLETAGMELTPPTTCDVVAASRALDEAVYGEVESLRPACELGCRVETCRAMVVEAEVESAMYDDELGRLLPQIATRCEQTVDSCLATSGVVMFDDAIDELAQFGFELPSEDDVDDVDEMDDVDESVDEALDDDSDELAVPDPALVTGCEQGDAAACYALVDMDLVLNYDGPWELRELAMGRWQRACDLEPMVYCRALERAIEYTTDEGCGG